MPRIYEQMPQGNRAPLDYSIQKGQHPEIKADQHRFEKIEIIGNLHAQSEKQLGQRRIDRRYRFVVNEFPVPAAKRLRDRIGRGNQVGIDTLQLHFSFPEVAEDIVRKNGKRRQQRYAKDKGR